MTIDNFNILFKKDQNKFYLINKLNKSECKFVKLKDLIELINKNIFNNQIANNQIIQILYRIIYKKCNKLYLINEQIIENINNYDIIQMSHKNKFYNYTSIKIKIEEYLTNSKSPHHVKFKKY